MPHINESTNRGNKNMVGPTLAFSDELHAEKYRSPGEGFRDCVNRGAFAMKDDDAHYHKLRELMLQQAILFAGRVQAAMGSTKGVTPYNCFVSGVIEDSFVHGAGCIMDRAKEAATTMRMGGGIGFDFSTLRPNGSMIKKLQSRTKGPVSFMGIFNETGLCTSSKGDRRGAMMAVIRVDHPDIEEFIYAKRNETSLTGFNISVGITDEFMRAAKAGRSFDLRWGGEVYKTVDAATLWEAIMRSTWDWAEPGVIFLDRINRMNNLWYCENITTTNPCGEQPLPPYGACLLGSINLTKFVIPRHQLSKETYTQGYFDWDAFGAAIPVFVRALDNVIDRAEYPLPQQAEEAQNKRRIGIGVTGLANTVEALGYPYGSPDFIKTMGQILHRLKIEAYLASIELAKEKGPFPLLERDRYLKSEFVATLGKEIQDGIKEHGIRNSHLTSIAPTGTISLCADNVSSGIEPVFAYKFERKLNLAEGLRFERVEDYGVRVFGVRGKTADKVTAEEHLNVLAAAYKHVDSAVSKTCNVGPDVGWEDFKDIYFRAWELGCKGCTTFRASGKREGILTVHEDDDLPSEGDVVADKVVNGNGSACYVDEQTGQRECE